MKKSILSLAVAFVCAVMSAACSSSGDKGDSTIQEVISQPQDAVVSNTPSTETNSNINNNSIAVKPSSEQEVVDVEEAVAEPEPDPEPDPEPEYQNNGKVITTTDKTFNQLCINVNTDDIMCPVPFIIDYNATWCGPCRQLAPILEKVQKSYGNKIQIFSVDIDKCPKAASYFEFDAIPTLIFVTPDGEWNQITGGLSEQALRKNIKKYLKVE
ncbi:MAG: hypothetical protein IKS00_02120 [Bacteroidales bacterium]|nr:hypothetical protein [Bacteroidales bacterium]